MLTHIMVTYSVKFKYYNKIWFKKKVAWNKVTKILLISEGYTFAHIDWFYYYR